MIPVEPRPTIPRVLSIAGTDPTGGAGSQADLKSIAANGGYGMAVITTLVAQNTCGVRCVHQPPVDFLLEQLAAVAEDVTVDALKIGMLGTTEVALAVAGWLKAHRPPVVVLDPVIVATSGDRLLTPAAEAALRQLARRADLITPNLAELAVLADASPATTWEGALQQGGQVAQACGAVVLVKGGHLSGANSPDALVNPEGGVLLQMDLPRIVTANTHGTGCSLSAAMATWQVRTGNWAVSLVRTRHWLQEALRHAKELQVGHGHGPVHHFAMLWHQAARCEEALPVELLGGAAVWTETTDASLPSAAGSFTAQWWRGTRVARTAIDRLPFVRALADGSLDRQDFLYYLAQDALYLDTYAQLLAHAGQLASTADEREFWASSAGTAREVELQMHRTWLKELPCAGRMGPATRAYLAHLEAADRQGHAVLLAALLPCFWIYLDTGRRLCAKLETHHAYAEWIETYGGDAFAEGTQRAIAFTEAAASTTDASTRERMRRAFQRSACHELLFFAAPCARQRGLRTDD